MNIPQLHPSDSLPLFLHLHSISLNGLKPASLGRKLGTGLVHSSPYDPSAPLLKISSALVVTCAAVDRAAKCDPTLRAALDAVPNRPMVVYTLLMMAIAAGATGQGIGDFWSEYVRYLPAKIPLPTMWSPCARKFLANTSLAAPVAAKLATLKREWDMLSSVMEGVNGMMGFNDWLYADAAVGSRVFGMPGGESALVPVLDLANHAVSANARYGVVAETNDMVLWPISTDEGLHEGQQVTIDYSGGEKSAAEMVFNYGFIPDGIEEAGRVVLYFRRALDDPLDRAKAAAWGGKLPLITIGPDGGWTCGFVWLAVVNEEDGLEFRVLRTVDGDEKLEMVFAGEVVKVGADLVERLRRDPLWEVFQLRAVVMIKETVLEILCLPEVEVENDEKEDDKDAIEIALRLRALELKLLEKAFDKLNIQEAELIEHPTVTRYLKSIAIKDPEQEQEHEEENGEGYHSGEIDLS